MVPGASIRKTLRHLRKTPLHPQWLWPDDMKGASEFLSMASGLVLDIGCADSWVKPRLPQGCRYVGLDYPATGLALYKSRPDILADAAYLPLADSSVDTVLMLDVLEHIRSPGRALEESLRVLRPGGKLLISIPFLYPIHDAPHDYQRLTVHGLRRDMDEVGFRVESLERTSGSFEASGLLMCLALAGSMHEAFRQRSAWSIAAPFVLALIPIVNLASWLAGRRLPAWPALTSGYRLTAIKPQPICKRDCSIKDEW